MVRSFEAVSHRIVRSGRHAEVACICDAMHAYQCLDTIRAWNPIRTNGTSYESVAKSKSGLSVVVAS